MVARSPSAVEVDCLDDASLPCERLMHEIQTLNPTAGRDYLSRFSERELRLYLDHLTATCEPRGRMARWLRRAETHAIQRYIPSDED